VLPEWESDRPLLAIVLAGGSGRRLGSVDKPALKRGGVSLLDIALAAVAPALTVVVGPARDLPAQVLQTREQPPAGGPCAAIAAGVSRLAETVAAQRCAESFVTILAADLPGIDAAAIQAMAAAASRARAHGAVLVDPDGRDQYLCGVWRFLALTAAVRARPSWHGGRVADLLRPLIGVRVPADATRTADVDTPADLRRWGIDPPGPHHGG